MPKPKLIKHPETGEELTARQWAEKLGIPLTRIRARARRTEDISKILSPQCGFLKTIKHPETGEELSVKVWCERLGISPQALNDRIKTNNGDLVRVLDPDYKRVDAWSEEEEQFLISIYKTPRYYKVWKSHAKKNGWRDRDESTVRAKVTDLQRRGVISKKRQTLESDGWLTVTSLSNYLGVSRNASVNRWIKDCGLTAYRDGNNPKSPIRIHLKHFVDWATSEDGAGEVAKAVDGNRLAIAWLMRAIGLWIFEEYPQVGVKKIVGESLASTRKKK